MESRKSDTMTDSDLCQELLATSQLAILEKTVDGTMSRRFASNLGAIWSTRRTSMYSPNSTRRWAPPKRGRSGTFEVRDGEATHPIEFSSHPEMSGISWTPRR
jgi:hypothetical protein